MSAKPPLWIKLLAIKGYKLYNPCTPTKEMSVDEMLYFVAEYALYLERCLSAGEGT